MKILTFISVQCPYTNTKMTFNVDSCRLLTSVEGPTS